MRITNVIIGKEALFNTNLNIVMIEIRKIQSGRVTIQLKKIWIWASVGKRIRRFGIYIVQKVAKREEEKCWPVGQQCQRI